MKYGAERRTPKNALSINEQYKKETKLSPRIKMIVKNVIIFLSN